MDRTKIKNQLLSIFRDIAPECEEITLEEQINLQDQLDLDSVDMMNYIGRIQEVFTLEIPNQAYQTFMTLKGAIDYLEANANPSNAPDFKG